MASLPSFATRLKTSRVPCLLFIIFLNSSCQAENILYPREALSTENFLAYGYNYIFRMQSDCNLVLYDAGNPIWASNTGGLASGCTCIMQSDGNLVIYSSSGTPIWASNTNIGEGNYVLILQRDRNVVIYGSSIWATHTHTLTSIVPIPAIPLVDQPDANDIPFIEDTNTLSAGETLYTEEFLAYGKNYVFRMQTDCNLVLYETGKPLWASNTGGLARNCRCTLQYDGNLVIFSSSGARIWASNTSRGQGNYLLLLQRDRNVVIYGPARWSTRTHIVTSAGVSYTNRTALIEGIVANRTAPTMGGNVVNRTATAMGGGVVNSTAPVDGCVTNRTSRIEGSAVNRTVLMKSSSIAQRDAPVEDDAAAA